MKNLLLILSFTLPFSLFGSARQIEIKTEKVKEAIHWSPAKIEVTQGEKVEFIAKHEVEGGFDFHGLFIPVLKISEQVNRNKPTTASATIPADLKPGDYPIGCQFHPKHVPATLVVKKK